MNEAQYSKAVGVILGDLEIEQRFRCYDLISAINTAGLDDYSRAYREARKIVAAVLASA